MNDIYSCKEWLNGVILAVIFVALMALITYLKHEPVDVAQKDIVEATVVGHSEGRTGIASADPYFVMKLSNGGSIKVRDLGELPSTYSGKVRLVRGTGVLSGLDSYRIYREPEALIRQ